MWTLDSQSRRTVHCWQVFDVRRPPRLTALQALHQHNQHQKQPLVQLRAGFSAQRSKRRAVSQVAQSNIRTQQEADRDTEQALCINSGERSS